MKTTRQSHALIAIALHVCLASTVAVATELPLGVVEKPDGEARSVEITDGPYKGKFMVAYTQEWTTATGAKIAVLFEPIPGGVFQLGSPAGETNREAHEGPQVEIKVAPFWIAKYEITWDQFDPWINLYRPIKDAKLPQKIAASQQADAVSIPTPIWEQDAVPIIEAMGREGGFPASHMSQLNARQYTKWMSKHTGNFYRLPSEAEWEYAARAGTTTPYFFGDDPETLAEYAWYFDNSEWDDADRGHPDTGAGYRKVGQKKANPWGLYDVYGNVAEWCIDQRTADAYAQFKAKGEPVAAADAIVWPTEYYGRVLRGGHWDSDGSDCRSAARLACKRAWKDKDPQLPQSVWYFTEFWFGFRPVRPLTAPSNAVQMRFWEPDYDAWKKTLKDGKQAQYLVPEGKK